MGFVQIHKIFKIGRKSKKTQYFLGFYFKEIVSKLINKHQVLPPQYLKILKKN